MAKIKGTILVSLKSYITKKYGYAGWKRYLGRFSRTEKREIEMPSAKHWYDLGFVFVLLHRLEEEFGGGPKSIVQDFGQHDAQRDLNTVQRLFLRLANPAFVLEKASDYWRNFCDFGHWKIERRGKTGAVATLMDCPTMDEVYCTQLQGYLVRMLELVGARNVVIEHTECQANGAQHCVFLGHWN